MMNVSTWKRLGAPMLLLSAMVGCDQIQGMLDKGEQPAAAEEGSPAAAKEAGPCAEYASKLCEEAGEKSPTCDAVKKTTDIMPAAACKAGISDIAFSKAKLADAAKQCDELMTKLCADLGEDTQTCDMVKTQTKQFPPERCQSMLGQYDKVLADLEKMEARNKPLSEEQQTKITAAGAPAFGPEDAKVTLVEFSDFQCPYCAKAADVVTKVKEKYGDKVRFVFRQFPLSFHKNAHDAAEAALAAGAQGKFWEYHDQLFANQKQLDRASLEKYAKELKLNMAEFKKALDSEKLTQQVDDDFKLGNEVGVSGTPTVFLNGKRVANPTDFSLVSKLIEAELEKQS